MASRKNGQRSSERETSSAEKSENINERGSELKMTLPENRSNYQITKKNSIISPTQLDSDWIRSQVTCSLRLANWLLQFVVPFRLHNCKRTCSSTPSFFYQHNLIQSLMRKTKTRCPRTINLSGNFSRHISLTFFWFKTFLSDWSEMRNKKIGNAISRTNGL